MKPTPQKTSAAPSKATLCRRLDRITREFRVICLREEPFGDFVGRVWYPNEAADYWRNFICKSPSFNPEVECLFVLLLNTRSIPKGHHLVATGTRDTILSHPIEVFRPAVIAATARVLLFHNHPSGVPEPSEQDITVTRALIRAGKVLKIEVLDHLIMGRASSTRPKDYCSLRELGYFYE